MSSFKEIKWNSTLNLIVFLVIGLLLLIFPKESLNIAGYLIASTLMLAGITYIVRIIKKKGIDTNSDLLSLVLSIIMIGVSITIFVDPTWIIRAINIVIGLLLIINSSMNIASLLKFKKDRTASWWIFLVFIVIIFILGILVIINPEALAKIVVRLEGATLVFNTLVTLRDYANAIIRYFDPNKTIFKFGLYRYDCVNVNDLICIKDLRIIENIDMKKIILIDNNIYSFANQLNNGILINSFYGDKNDIELFNVLGYLFEYILLGPFLLPLLIYLHLILVFLHYQYLIFSFYY